MGKVCSGMGMFLGKFVVLDVVIIMNRLLFCCRIGVKFVEVVVSLV